jgi:hypothetical protein
MGIRGDEGDGWESRGFFCPHGNVPEQEQERALERNQRTRASRHRRKQETGTYLSRQEVGGTILLTELTTRGARRFVSGSFMADIE